MKTYQNSFEIQEEFKTMMREKMKSFKIEVLESDFHLGIEYLINDLTSFQRNCVIGLTESETFIVRQFFGFNKENSRFYL